MPSSQFLLPPCPAQSKFRQGVFTSASKRTVEVAVAMLEEAAGTGPPLFDPRLILHRVHTEPASAAHVKAEGSQYKPWDTVKPLHRHFGRLHRVVLLDDDAYKVCLLGSCAGAPGVWGQCARSRAGGVACRGSRAATPPVRLQHPAAALHKPPPACPPCHASY